GAARLALARDRLANARQAAGEAKARLRASVSVGSRRQDQRRKDECVAASAARGAAVTPRVLIHVQHLLGIGHLQRAAAIASALREAGGRVVLASGGVPVPQVEARAAAHGVEVVRLPEARAADVHFSKILDAHGQPIDEAWKARRKDMLLGLL